MQVLFCPIGRHRWRWDGLPIMLPRSVSKDREYLPKPTKLGVCTCGICHREPVPKHIEPNAGSTPRSISSGDEPSPWQENAIRALEDANDV